MKGVEVVLERTGGSRGSLDELPVKGEESFRIIEGFCGRAGGAVENKSDLLALLAMLSE